MENYVDRRALMNILPDWRERITLNLFEIINIEDRFQLRVNNLLNDKE